MSDYYLGEIKLFSGNYIPQDWAACDGALIPISQNEQLFSLIGTTWGGDGRANFALPDLRGRIPIGQGQGLNLTARQLASKDGQVAVALTQATSPQHTHSVNVLKNLASTPDPTDNTIPATAPNNVAAFVQEAKMSGTFDFSTAMVGTVGASQFHNNLMPFLALTYMICINGVYPPRPN